MLECVVAGCNANEKFLRSGSLYLMDVVAGDGRPRKKMVWLCADCSRRYMVETWRPAGEQIQARRVPAPFVVAEAAAAGNVVMMKAIPETKHVRSAA